MDPILLVDDSAAVHRLVDPIVARLGRELVHAYDGAEALRLVSTAEFSLVILDLYMPILDGMSFLRMLPGAGSSSQLPVLVISSSGEDEDVRRAFGFGARAFLQKPFSPALLEETLRRILGQERLVSVR